LARSAQLAQFSYGHINAATKNFQSTFYKTLTYPMNSAMSKGQITRQ
jgi:hypothetical protein